MAHILLKVRHPWHGWHCLAYNAKVQGCVIRKAVVYGDLETILNTFTIQSEPMDLES